MSALVTRKPTGLPPWPLLLLAGGEKCGKSWAAAQMSASDLIGRTFWIEIGEGAADLYGSLPGARYEIVEHDGTFRDILRVTRLASQEQGDKPNAIVIDSMTELWDLLVEEQQGVASERARKKGRKFEDAPIGMDQWNTAKKRWRDMLSALRAHSGPVVLTARLEQVTVVADGQPTTDKTWKVRAEKNLGYEVDGTVQIPRPREFYLDGFRSVKLQIPPGAHVKVPDFTIDMLFRDLGLDSETGTREYTAPNPNAATDTDEEWLAITREHIEAARTGTDLDAVGERITQGKNTGLCSDDDYQSLIELGQQARKALEDA